MQEDHEVVGEDPDEELALSAFVGACAEGVAHVPLESGENAFALPALSVDPAREVVLHQPAVTALGLTSESVAGVDGNRSGSDSQFLAAEAMEMLRVETGVGQDPLDPEVNRSLADDRFEAGSIIGRSQAHRSPADQMRGVVRGHGQFHESPETAGTLALAPQEIAAGVVALQTGGVNRYVGPRRYQAASAGTVEYSAEQALESPFFSSRCSAFQSPGFGLSLG